MGGVGEGPVVLYVMKDTPSLFVDVDDPTGKSSTLLPLRSERWVILGAVRDGGPSRGAAAYFPFGQRGSTVSGRQ